MNELTYNDIKTAHQTITCLKNTDFNAQTQTTIGRQLASVATFVTNESGLIIHNFNPQYNFNVVVV